MRRRGRSTGVGSHISRISSWKRLRRGLLTIIGVGTAGFIGNRFDYFFVQLWKMVTRFITNGGWSSGFILGILVAIVLLGVPNFIQIRGLRASATILTKLTELDDTTIRSVPVLASPENRAGKMERLLQELLRDCVSLVGEDVRRGLILRIQGEYLVPWADHEMSGASMARTRFYIGPDNQQRRGVAGDVARDGKVAVVHMLQTDEGWKADNSNYLVFDENRARPPYQSFVAVPLMWREQCLGVMCLDSTSPAAFDSPEMQSDLLLPLGRRIAAVILLYQTLEDTDRHH